MGRDGKWRQWEAYDCVNVDSVHNDGERHIPYMTIFPDSTRNKLLAWGKVQLGNGMIPEQLACGCTGAIDPGLDKGCGRVMSDVSSMYIVYVLELYKWQNDTETLHTLWPVPLSRPYCTPCVPRTFYWTKLPFIGKKSRTSMGLVIV